MDYLRTLGSAAVSTIVQKSGLNLPFSLGSKVSQPDSYYTLYDATKRARISFTVHKTVLLICAQDDSSQVSVFEYDFSDASRKYIRPFAQNALKKLRTTRHPDILKFMDAVESDTTIYIMTERVRPLSPVLAQYSSKTAKDKEDWLLWGLHRIAVALSFVNEQCLSTHGRVSTGAIFVTPSGEWKLGGFEVFSNSKDEAALLYTMATQLPGISSLAPPEVKKSSWSSLKGGNPAPMDAYSLGLLLQSVFNPTHPPLATIDPPHPPPSPANRGSIPNSVFPLFKKLLTPNPAGRLTASGFLQVGMAETGFFANNRLLQVCSSLDNFALSAESEKAQFLRNLKESVSSLPTEFACYKVLPSLISALEFGGSSAAAIVPLVLLFGANLSPDEYSKLVLAQVVKLYASPDRNTRMALLDNLSMYSDKLDKKTVSEKIFPHIQLGFSDTVPLIRESTLKAMTLLAPKLTDRLLNNDLLRLLAKLQMDTEPSIRTNTCILLGKLGPTLGHNTKQKVLVPAFTRALKDSFVHARVAGLSAFMATIDCFEIPELATKVIPNMAFALVDSEKLVRDQAFKAMGIFMEKLGEHVATMPETAIVPVIPGTDTPIPGALPVPGTLVNSATGAAGSLAGWAISSIGGMIAASEVPGGASKSDLERTTSAPAESLSSHIGEIKRPQATSWQSSPAIKSATFGQKGKSLQLGGPKPQHNFDALADELVDEAASATLEGNPWGSDDLMDVEADADDWSAFESAPSATPVKPSAPAPRINVIPTSASTQHAAVRTPIASASIQRAQSPVARPASSQSKVSDDLQPATPAASMSKEDRAQEMARRKEERKQRIAMLKEQKKTAAKT